MIAPPAAQLRAGDHARRGSRLRRPRLAWLALAACSSAPPVAPATTSGAIAVANLDHLIAERAADPAVVELLLTRARFLGDTDALDRAVALAEPAAGGDRAAALGAPSSGEPAVGPAAASSGGAGAAGFAAASSEGARTIALAEPSSNALGSAPALARGERAATRAARSREVAAVERVGILGGRVAEHAERPQRFDPGRAQLGFDGDRAIGLAAPPRDGDRGVGRAASLRGGDRGAGFDGHRRGGELAIAAASRVARHAAFASGEPGARTLVLGGGATSDREAGVAGGGDAAPARRPTAGAAALLRRAQARGAVHRFREALTDLAAAARAGADVTVARAAILVATGRAVDAIPALEADARRRPGYASNAALAGAYAALGRFADADARYASARAALDTTSPLPYAWLDFARGLMWSEQAGDPSRGAAYYTAALARMPQLTVAALHLAEIEAARGDLDLALARLAPIAALDPSALALLGELHVRSGRPILGFIELTRARAQLEALVARHPLAFADHAAEVHLFAGGDPARAWALATQNLDNRATLRAWRLAATSARATNRPLAPLLARPPRSW